MKRRSTQLKSEQEPESRVENSIPCPVPGCDSKGHLSGKFDFHSAAEACPCYHHLTPEDCKSIYQKRIKLSADVDRLEASFGDKKELRQRPLQKSQSTYRSQVDRLRKTKTKSSTSESTRDEPSRDREGNLLGLTSEFDLNLFRQAQSQFAEAKQEQENHDDQSAKLIEFGTFEIESWYRSPYPDEYAKLRKIFICEFCLKYMRSAAILRRHMAKCVWRHPPGDEIYRKNNINFFEVDGKKSKVYCQNLCLLARLFLDHKTLYYEVEPFLFYVMTEYDSKGCHIVGYFSKEKHSLMNYNLSCILTLPHQMKKGFGRMLIDFSYNLSKIENRIGSPEKPLSDLGLISYRSYWTKVLMHYLADFEGKDISIKEISQETGIHLNDIISTFQYLGMVKYWKGKHIILRREDLIKEYSQHRVPESRKIDPTFIHWVPAKPKEDG